MQIKTFILVKCPVVQVFQSKRAAFSAHGEGAVAQLPKQSYVQSEGHDSEMLHQDAGPRCQTTALPLHLHNGSEPCLSHD